MFPSPPSEVNEFVVLYPCFPGFNIFETRFLWMQFKNMNMYEISQDSSFKSIDKFYFTLSQVVFRKMQRFCEVIMKVTVGSFLKM